jgi:ABC-2 type transport system permease protein
VRWLLRKDLLILRRSRLLVVLLVLYPVTIALLIGLALSRGPSRPRVAIVDETPPGETVRLGSQRVEVGRYARQVLDQVDAVTVPTRAQAVEKVKNGEVLAAIVIPPDIAARLESNLSRAPLEVVYNGNALEQSLVRSTIDSAIAKADVTFSEQIQQAAARAIDGLLRGGEVAGLGASEPLIGLNEIPPALRRIIAREPPGQARDELKRIEAVASFAAANLDASKKVLATVGSPISVTSTLLHGRRTPLNRFAVVVAVTVSLMFLGVLLAAGSVALEREEGVLARLLRGLVSRETLLAEKVLLAAGCAFALAIALLAGIGAFVALDWGRVGQWLAALAAGGLAFGAVGTAIGALAREVRAASLLAFLASLPLAFLALVPAGSVSHGFHDVIDVISFVFPYKAALQALDAAVNGASPGLVSSIVHLLVLALAYAALARLALTRAD